MPDFSQFLKILEGLTLVNWIGLGLLITCWLLYPFISRWLPKSDLTTEIEVYRHKWMAQMLHREERITDVSLARGLFGSVSFFASTTVLLISGLIGLLASAPSLYENLTRSSVFDETGLAIFEVKICVLIIIFIHAFFKFGWSMRLHTYSMIFIGAAPQREWREGPEAAAISTQAGELSALASRHYFEGMRGYYFGLATLPWFISPVLLIISVLLTMAVLIRREHYSRALSIVRQHQTDAEPGQ